ncbi:hypothetical protein THAOC_15137 [Thalassiosira oceanica]|uniref:Uncharacterized protein n=1 Tax=Thalassiosira oceanica TaxID=159749 RepID=K0SDJ9_THAOC|nr:hypothetical protein THAOC_15137 [Thalassiosira oceanica]|eukprot:EJK64158.1 hypothetical protein THAOC_15137 [Thalassiosira oceanica]
MKDIGKWEDEESRTCLTDGPATNRIVNRDLPRPVPRRAHLVRRRGLRGSDGDARQDYALLALTVEQFHTLAVAPRTTVLIKKGARPVQGTPGGGPVGEEEHRAPPAETIGIKSTWARGSACSARGIARGRSIPL